MTLIIETGGGVREANAYASVSFVTSYLTSLNRETDWSAATVAVQEAAIVAATSYIDTRWGSRFRSNKLTSFDGVKAQALASFNANPSSADSITIGSHEYEYKTALGTLAQYEIEIGADLEETLQSTIDAVTSGIPDSTPANSEVTAAFEEGSTSVLLLTALQAGSSGNDIPLSVSLTGGGALTPFKNGLDVGSQPLQFPRSKLYDSDWVKVVGIPLKLKQAMAEYADRARTELLYIDPVTDDSGRAIIEKQEIVGPIEDRTKYEEGSGMATLLKPYPAADQLLAEYLKPTGMVIR